MLGFSLLMLVVFVIAFSMVIVITEGLTKITLAGIVAFFSLSWGYVLAIWSSFVEFIIDPALNTLYGIRPLDFFGVSTIMVLFSMLLFTAVMVGNIIVTASQGAPKIFQNLTKDKTDGL